MYHKDFILRLMEDFFRFLSVILKLRKEEDFKGALAKCDETSLALLRININTIESLTNDELKHKLEALSLLPAQTEILAALLYQKSEIYFESDAAFSAKNTVQKSLWLYQIIAESSKTFSVDIEMKTRRLKEMETELTNKLTDC